MSTPLGELSPGQFLESYWQKKPCLIRNAFPAFEPMLDGDDLAGLACEELVEARLVLGTYEASDWSVRHGPFVERDFAGLPATGWTLLVQDVEKHYAPLQEVMRHFNFIPGWRIDDLMMSYAAEGGSVGPHTDQYDVFLLQAEGRRRWQIAQDYAPELLPDCPLNVLQQFEPEQEWVLETGDMLYLPPGVAHHGIALEPGMTWSIGARAPSGADLLQALGEWLAFSPGDGGRYVDPDLQPAGRAGEIDSLALQRLRELMLGPLEDSTSLGCFLAAFTSRFRLAHEPMPPETQIDARGVLQALTRGAEIMRNPWTRLVWVELDDSAQLYAAGTAYPCSVSLAETLCGMGPITPSRTSLDNAGLETVTALVNAGHLLLID